MLSDEEKMEEFEKLVKPISKWLFENYDPHTTVIITDNYAKLVQDNFGSPIENG